MHWPDMATDMNHPRSCMYCILLLVAGLLEISPVERGVVTLYGVRSELFVAMNSKGKLYGSVSAQDDLWPVSACRFAYRCPMARHPVLGLYPPPPISLPSTSSLVYPEIARSRVLVVGPDKPGSAAHH